MNQFMKPGVVRTSGIFCVGVLIAGCGGGGRHYNGGGGVPHTTSSYSYSLSIGSTGQLSEPDAISIDKSGNLYVASYAGSTAPKVTEFTSTGAFVADFGNTGTSTTGLLTGPQGVYVDASGNKYVADTSGQIVVYGSTNTFKQYLLTGQVGTFPYQISADASGNLYVASSDLAEVLKFNAAGSILATLGKAGASQGILNDPDGVGTDAAGNIYVSDYGNHQIVEYSSAGAFVKSFGNTGTYRLSGPQGLTVNPTYGIFVADISNSYVYHYDLNGNFIETIGDSSGAGALLHPYDVTVASDGGLLVVDSGNNRVVEYRGTAQPAKSAGLTAKP